MSARRTPLILVLGLALALLAGASLVQAAGQRQAKPRRVCHWRRHRRICVTVRPTTAPRRLTTTSSSTTTTATSTTHPVTVTTTTSSSATSTTATQTTTTSSTTTGGSLAHGTEVDELATGRSSPFYAMNAYEPTLAAGTVHFNVYNYDQDPHTFAIADVHGTQLSATFQVPAGHSGTPVTVTATLAPGTYVLYCTLPQHAADGMRTTIVVK